MAIDRVSDSQAFALLNARVSSLQASLRQLTDQIGSGRRFTRPEEDPLAAGQVVRYDAELSSLAGFNHTSTFGREMLGVEDRALADAYNVMVRAEEIATQQANGTLSPEDRLASREEVHGLLEALTSIGNTEFLGRRVFAGLADNAPAPFADPNTGGYDASTAYVGSTQEFSIKIGSTSTERVRITTRGDQIFANALIGLQNLENTLASNGNAAADMATLAQGRTDIANERTSVGARGAALDERKTQVAGLTDTALGARGKLQDADLTATISALTQAQTALQAILQAGSLTIQTSLVNMLQV